MRKPIQNKSIQSFTNYKLNNLSFIKGGGNVGSGGIINVAIGDDSEAKTNVSSVES